MIQQPPAKNASEAMKLAWIHSAANVLATQYPALIAKEEAIGQPFRSAEDRANLRRDWAIGQRAKDLKQLHQAVWKMATKHLPSVAVECKVIPGVPASLSPATIDAAAREWRTIAVAALANNQTDKPATNQTLDSEPPKIIKGTIAVKRYHVAMSTLRRNLGVTLTDHRPAGHAKNAPLLLDENEVSQLWGRK